MLRTIISFIVVFNLIVFVHELGHYIQARRNGIKVHEFSLGMGPAILQTTKNDILYALRAFPIGGFVRMEGEDTDSHTEDSFNTKSPWVRFKVLVQGSLNNLILALVLFMIMNSVQGVPSNEISGFNETHSPAKEAGVMLGDEILRVNGTRTPINMAVNQALAESEGPVTLTLRRDGETLDIRVTPDDDNEYNQRMVGVSYDLVKGPLNILIYTLNQMWFLISTIFIFLGRLITGNQDMSMVAGPVGIVQEVGRAASFGILPLIFLTGYISMNLGIVNLLPIPAMDGGRIVFIIIEAIRGKPLAPEKEGIVHAIGFVALIALMLVVTFFDVQRLFWWNVK